MNWKECVKFNEAHGLADRFDWPVGPNLSGFDCNEAFTFNDVWGAVAWVWNWPGDYILNSDAVKGFFEIGPETIVAGMFSIWLPIILLFIMGIFLDS
ncbi:hypothetical protein LZG00_09255 [Rhodobacteraceae bacterium LMO-12]|nr:hypothetical protein [Rhodobacteraceae bacterium LMO-JJ12]